MKILLYITCVLAVVSLGYAVDTTEELESIISTMTPSQPVCIFFDIPSVLKSPMHTQWRTLWQGLVEDHDAYQHIRFESFDCGKHSAYSRDVIKINVMPSVRCYIQDPVPHDVAASSGDTDADGKVASPFTRSGLQVKELIGSPNEDKMLKLLTESSGLIPPTTAADITQWSTPPSNNDQYTAGKKKKGEAELRPHVIGICRPASACPALRTQLFPLARALHKQMSFHILPTDFGDNTFRQFANKHRINRFPTVLYIENDAVRTVRNYRTLLGAALPANEAPASEDIAQFITDSFARYVSISPQGQGHHWRLGSTGARGEGAVADAVAGTIGSIDNTTVDPATPSIFALYHRPKNILKDLDSPMWHSFLLLSREQYITDQDPEAQPLLVDLEEDTSTADNSTRPPYPPLSRAVRYVTIDLDDPAWQRHHGAVSTTGQSESGGEGGGDTDGDADPAVLDDSIQRELTSIILLPPYLPCQAKSASTLTSSNTSTIDDTDDASAGDSDDIGPNTEPRVTCPTFAQRLHQSGEVYTGKPHPQAMTNLVTERVESYVEQAQEARTQAWKLHLAQEAEERERLARANTPPEFTGLPSLTSQGWRTSYSKATDKHLLAFYVRESCHYCEHMLPTFTTVAEAVHNDTALSSRLRVALVNCTTTPSACEEFPIPTYPAVFMLRHRTNATKKDLCYVVPNRADPVMLDGALTQARITEFARQHSQNMTSSLTGARVPGAGSIVVRVTLGDGEGESECDFLSRCLATLAERFYRKVHFEIDGEGQCVEEAILERRADDVEEQIYPLQEADDEGEMQVKRVKKKKDLPQLLAQRISSLGRPYIEEFMSYTLRSEPEDPLPVVLAIVHSERKEDRAFTKAFREVAMKHYSDDLIFCIIDAKTYWRFTSTIQDPDVLREEARLNEADGTAPGINADGSPDLSSGSPSTAPASGIPDTRVTGETFPRVVVLAGYGYSRVAYPQGPFDLHRAEDIDKFVQYVRVDTEGRTRPIRVL